MRAKRRSGGESGYIAPTRATSLEDVPLEWPDDDRKLLRGVPSYPLPALRIARLAVQSTSQRRGIGGELLKAALLIAKGLADTAGCVGVLVDAKREAIRFYGAFGFEALGLAEGELGERPAPTAMFLPIGSIPR
jgi:GNAT superfamily N-acetyltransferase